MLRHRETLPTGREQSQASGRVQTEPGHGVGGEGRGDLGVETASGQEVKRARDQATKMAEIIQDQKLGEGKQDPVPEMC